MSYSALRAAFAATLDSVVDDREEVIITRAGKAPVVMVALDDYEALQETAQLLQGPASTHRALKSIERLESGGPNVEELFDRIAAHSGGSVPFDAATRHIAEERHRR